MIQIGDLLIGLSERPFVIAEMSGNHNGSLDRAVAIVDAIADSGAQALKLQTYTAETMTLDLTEGEFYIDNPKSPWHGRTLYSLYDEAHTPWEWHERIFERARARGLAAFSTPFDASSVAFLETLDVPAYKIASFEITDLQLIRTVAATGKPVIISTGMASLAEIDEAVRAARAAGCRDLILLKCTSNYPASAASSNLATIPYLRNVFECEVGLSDHTLGLGVAVASVALGATVIEKHVTLNRADGGVDAAFSLEPAELRQLVTATAIARESMGTSTFGPTPEEKASLSFRRTLYVVEDLEAGDSLSERNVRAIRPGHGLPPKHLPDVLGKGITRAAKKGTPLTWDLIG